MEKRFTIEAKKGKKGTILEYKIKENKEGTITNSYSYNPLYGWTDWHGWRYNLHIMDEKQEMFLNQVEKVSDSFELDEILFNLKKVNDTYTYRDNDGFDIIIKLREIME